MTSVRFKPHGFSVKGHCTADEDDVLGKLVCSAVSSAVYMTVNTITDVVCDKADIKEKDGELSINVLNPSKETITILEGLKIHIQQLEEQYKICIKVYLEV